eukprot:4848875-Pleurochrysis_carterae.AAC.2
MGCTYNASPMATWLPTLSACTHMLSASLHPCLPLAYPLEFDTSKTAVCSQPKPLASIMLPTSLCDLHVVPKVFSLIFAAPSSCMYRALGSEKLHTTLAACARICDARTGDVAEITSRRCFWSSLAGAAVALALVNVYCAAQEFPLAILHLEQMIAAESERAAAAHATLCAKPPPYEASRQTARDGRHKRALL